jgi:chromosome partitioning protein
MTAKIISVVNQKGGAGKTNVSVHLAGTANRRGFKTLLIDGDKQGTATQWAANAEEGAPFKIRVMGLANAQTKIAQEVKQYVDDYDLIIVDCPPAVDSPIPRVMLMISDLALVPVIPNPGDGWASAALLELAEVTQQTHNPDLQIRIVASIVRPNLALTKEMLKQMGDMRESAPLLKTFIQQRTSYVEAMLIGDSAHGFGAPARAAIKELESLFDEVAKAINIPKVKKDAESKKAEVI